MIQSAEIYAARTDLTINRFYSAGMHSDEQHSATPGAIREDVRIDGRRQARGRRGEHIKGITTTTERRAGRSGHALRKQSGAADNSLCQRVGRSFASYQRRRAGNFVAAGSKKQRNCRG